MDLAIEETNKLPVIQDILASLRSLEYDVTIRNTYMNKRDRYIYGQGLYETLVFPDGFDRTTYNWLPRVVDIQSSQLMGRAFSTYSWYSKEDISTIDKEDKEALEQAKLTNRKRKIQADARKRLIDAIIRDNGGHGLFKLGARVGSAYGTTLFKAWYDKKKKKYRIQCIESPMNYRAGWTDTNFRDRDFDSFVYQLSEDQAYLQYGYVLKPDETFQVSQESYPLGQPLGNTNTSDPLDQNTATIFPVQTQRKMVTVVDFTGILRGWGVDRAGNVVPVNNGEEQPFSCLIVGGRLAYTITNEDLLPKYYVIRNRDVPRRAWGDSDLSDSALEINATYLERMSDFITVANKTLFPLIQAKGFDAASIPAKQQRKIQVVPMEVSQSIEPVTLPTNFGFEYNQILNELKEDFVRITGVSRVLFDDPTLNSGSNPGLTTTMKSIIDIVEDKQSRWTPTLVRMFTDALETIAKFEPAVREFVDTDDDWWLYIQWPNILRKEDPAYQTMLLNDLHTGAISIDTYMEMRGIPDVTEEIDRLRDALMNDPIRAAIHGNRLGELAQFTIFESLGVPLWGFNVPKIQLRGDLTPQQEGNMASLYGWNEGPFGASIGPQGTEGERSTEAAINQGFDKNPYLQKYGLPSSMQPGVPLNPQTMNGPAGSPMSQMPPNAPTPGVPMSGPAPVTLPNGVNIPQPMSRPGSGRATSQSAEGAARARKQRGGR